MSHCIDYELADVVNLDVLFFEVLERVAEHRAAVRARCADGVRFGLDGHLGADFVYPLSNKLLHPHAAAARAAAEAERVVFLHLDRRAACCCVDDRARLIVDEVVAAEVARVVDGHAAAVEFLRQFDLPLGEQFVDDLAVVEDLEIAAVLLVFVLKRVEAVRARGDDFLDVVCFEYFDVAFHHGRREVFVADAPRGFAAAHFLFAEDREADAGGFEYLRRALRDGFVFLVERRRAAEVEEVFRFRVLGERLYLEFRGPFGALVLADAPRVRVLFHVLECELHF